ncbi:MAG: antibiotic biosynthesis monooxygenase [Pirellulaceae bacterium]
MSLLKLISCLGVFIAFIGLPEVGWGQATSEKAPAKAQPEGRPQFPDLVGGLKKTPGCLGVEAAQTAEGKRLIFAWFKDKEAIMNWYDSDMHQGVVNKFFKDRDPREPLADVPDNSGPILAIASITFSDKPQLKGTSLPISQIAIELYSPVPGGLALGGRFAPDSVEVKNLKNYSKSDGKY